jgi:hypothetical protein
LDRPSLLISLLRSSHFNSLTLINSITLAWQKNLFNRDYLGSHACCQPERYTVGMRKTSSTIWLPYHAKPKFDEKFPAWCKLYRSPLFSQKLKGDYLRIHACWKSERGKVTISV